MSEKVKVEKRDILGKKVKKLRKSGLLPANVYGKDIESVSVQIPVKDFGALYEKVGETGIVEVSLDGKSIPALIHNVQIDPLTHNPIHADFLKINLKEKITAHIPIEIIGESPIVKEGQASFMNPISEIEVEALPTDLPEHIEVNIEGLEQIGDQITVKDIKVPQGVEVKTDQSAVVATIAEIKEEPEPEPVEPEDEGEAEAEAPKEEGEGEKEATEEKEEPQEQKQD